MTYIVRVIGYNAYWTGDTEPGKLWSTNIEESQRFDSTEEAQKIADSGQNMEVAEYSSALPKVVELKSIPDWDAVDEAEKQLKKMSEQQEIVNLNTEEFTENIDESIEEVDIEVIQ